MKKIIYFCLLVCLIGILFIGCPQNQSVAGTDTASEEVSSSSNNDSSSGSSFVSDSESGSEVSSDSSSESESATIITYMIAFDSNGGKAYPTMAKMKNIKTNQEAVLTKCKFTKVGYKFAEWNTAPEGTGESYADQATVTNLTNVDGEIVTLYAQWIPISYTIKFTGNGGVGSMDDVTLVYDEDHTLTNEFTAPSGKVFSYWSTDAEGKVSPFINGEKIINLTITDNDEITLYAQWCNEGEYRIIYTDPNNIIHNNPTTYTTSDNVIIEDITADGQTFLGWYSSSGELTQENRVTGWLAGTKSSTVLLWAKWATGSVEAIPGTIEPLPEAVSIIQKARQQIDPAENEVVFFYFRADGKYTGWSMWMWSTGGDGNNNWNAISDHGYSTTTVTVADASGDNHDYVVGYLKFNTEGTTENDCIAMTGAELDVIQNKGTFNFLVVKGKSGSEPNWGTKDPGPDMKWELMEGNYFGMISGQSDVYSIADDAKPQIMNAIMKDDNHLNLALSQKYAVTPYPTANDFTIESSDGQTLVITDMYCSDLKNESERATKNYSKQFIVTVENGIDYTKDWYIKHPEFIPTTGLKVAMTSALKNNISDMEYTGNDLGLTLNGSTAGFKIFAPIASEANVLLYADWNDAKADIDNVHNTQTTSDDLPNATRVAMRKTDDFDETGIWQASDVDVSGKNYYVYELKNVGTVYRVCDINALVAAPDSIAAQIIDINDSACKPTGWETEYTNPFGNSGVDTKTYTEAIIYEMHIRDWSKGIDADNVGKFDDITAGLGTNGDGVLGQHLKDLGITHVQILPMFDYAQTNDDDKYNWGYNPYHYNVPEGRYVNNHDDGGQEAVKQMRGMIKAFHDAGIAVNMDVVYNHTAGTGIGSLYDMTVPSYYYRLNNGVYSNGSGCGNETDSSMPMYRKYMIDSLSHWMRDYHINGFRFDLMGLHEAETMAAIYTALKEIDPNVMVYGEPWDGGESQCKNAAKKAGAVGNAGYGAFDDSFRNAIKGGEYPDFEKGQVQGTFTDSDIIKGLTGATTSRNNTGNPGLSIHYVECHDNCTLFDKLDISILDGERKEDWKPYDELTEEQQIALHDQNKLAAAFVFLAQGTPFMNGGQEFMRTKQGDENSYTSNDDINAIDMTFKETYSDVYNVYKGLIALRKTYDAFTNGTDVAAEKIANGVTRYTLSGTNGDFCVYFNATSDAVEIDSTGYDSFIDVTDGELDESVTLPTSVEATNFIILKK